MKFTKSPDEVLDYTLDWSARLGLDQTIVSSAWTISGGSAELGTAEKAPTFEGQASTFWVSGGARGETSTLENVIRTNSDPSRTFSFLFTLEVT